MIPAEQLKAAYGAEMTCVVMMCRMYLGNTSAESVQEFITRNTLNWTTIYNICAGHQVRPIIYEVITKNKIDVEEKFLARLKKVMMITIPRNQQKVKETIDLCTLLEQNNITAYPYKGVLLSKTLYGDYTSREISDIDLLIRKEDFFKTKELLSSIGYAPRYSNDTRRFYEHMLETDCEYKCAKAVGKTQNKVELHWSPTHDMLDVPLDNDTFFKNGTVTNIQNNEINALELHDHILTILVHHGVNDVWRSLRHLIDWAKVLEHETINHDLLNEKIQRVRLNETALMGTSMCHLLFGTNSNFSTNTDKANSILKHTLTFPLINKKKTSLTNFRLQLQLKDNAKDRVRLMRKYLTTSLKPGARDIQMIALPNGLYFLYYLLKPFRLLSAAISNNKTQN